MKAKKRVLTLSFGSAIILGVIGWFGLSEHASQAATQAIDVDASPIFWDPENPTDTKAGQLTYVGGLKLSSDHDAFGGLSGLIVGDTGDALIAVTDQGNWFTADLVWDGNRPTALANALISPILDETGARLTGKRDSDAEGLAVAAGQDPRTAPTFVSFERNARILSFDLTSLGFKTPATRVPDFGAFENLVENSGLEAIAILEDGSLVAFSEETLDKDGFITGTRLTETSATPLRLKQHAPYALTDLAPLPNGDLVTLERRYSPIGGVGLLIRRIPAVLLDGDAPLDGPVLLEANSSRSIDNMEGLDIRTGRDGKTLFYLVSDDNFNLLQRTLLLVFEYAE